MPPAAGRTARVLSAAPSKKRRRREFNEPFVLPARNTSRLASSLQACFLKPLVPPTAGRTARVLSAAPSKKLRRREFNEPFIYLLRRILRGLLPRCIPAFSSRSCRPRRAEPSAFFRQPLQKSGAAENLTNPSYISCAEYFAACFLAAGMLSQAARAACGGTNRARSFGRPFKKAAPPRIRRRRFFGGPARNRTAVLQGLSADTTRLVCDQISPAGSSQTTCSLGILPYDPLQGRKFSPEVGSLLF